MAIPFYIPNGENDENSSNASGDSTAAPTAQSTPMSTPSRPISIPLPLRNNYNSSPAASSSMQSSPSHSPMSNIDNETLVQAFYEALCRCSQGGTPMSPPMSPSSPFSHGQFFFPRHTPSTSTNSTPRQSFRVISRRRLNSHGSSAQYSEVDDEEETQMPQELFEWESHYVQREQMEEFTGQVPNPKSKGKKSAPSASSSSSTSDSSNSSNRQKPKKGTKITNFVISALQYVIDTLK